MPKAEGCGMTLSPWAKLVVAPSGVSVRVLRVWRWKAAVVRLERVVVCKNPAVSRVVVRTLELKGKGFMVAIPKRLLPLAWKEELKVCIDQVVVALNEAVEVVLLPSQEVGSLPKPPKPPPKFPSPLPSPLPTPPPKPPPRPTLKPVGSTNRSGLFRA